jgi:hypothetical protein
MKSPKNSFKKTNNKDKKQNNYINNANNMVHKMDQKKKREFKFASIQEALKGIDEKVIATDKVASANCWRISREEYYTLE